MPGHYYSPPQEDNQTKIVTPERARAIVLGQYASLVPRPSSLTKKRYSIALEEKRKKKKKNKREEGLVKLIT